jgi:hypothetical protein
MTEQRKPKKEQKPKRITHISGKLLCGRCAGGWMVVDLNPEHKVAKCPICSEPNDIREAVKRAL